jgi:hypothetical protein
MILTTFFMHHPSNKIGEKITNLERKIMVSVLSGKISYIFLHG